MTFLDRAQTLWPEDGGASSVCMLAGGRSDEIALTNAVVFHTAEAEAICLASGAALELDRPPERYRPAPRQRSQVTEHPDTALKPLDQLDAHRRFEAAATRLAAYALQRTRELAQNFDFRPDKIEPSVLTPQSIAPEALDLLVITVHDAARVAQLLWAADRLSGRTLSDVESVLAGKRCDVSADELLLSLILAGESAFEKKLTAIIKTAQQLQEAERLTTVISALRNRPPSDKTIREAHDQAKQTAQMLRGAIALVRQHGSLVGAIQSQPRTRASAVVEVFVRDHPSAGAGTAISRLTKLAEQFEQDGAALASCLERYGTRHVSSVPKFKPVSQRLSSESFTIGSYIQRIREARYASCQLPGLMERLRETFPLPALGVIIRLPFRELAERIESGRLIDVWNEN